MSNLTLAEAHERLHGLLVDHQVEAEVRFYLKDGKPVWLCALLDGPRHRPQRCLAAAFNAPTQEAAIEEALWDLDRKRG